LTVCESGFVSAIQAKACYIIHKRKPIALQPHSRSNHWSAKEVMNRSAQ